MADTDQNNHGSAARQVEPTAAAPKSAAREAVGQARVLGLDALRGLTILLMLLVNNFGSESYTPGLLTHAGWSGGVHLADFVFPWFLFCVGVAIPYSAGSFRNKGLPDWKYDLKALRRTAILMALGVIVSSSEAGKLVFSIGVLHIIGLAYLAGALLYDLPLHRRLFIALLLLVSYWVALTMLRVPGIGTGVVAEGRNIVHHVNRTYLAPIGLEGLPLIVPASALVLIGTWIGDVLRRRDMAPTRVVAWLMIVGLALVVGGELWSFSISINKPLWTPSYVLVAAGTGALLLGALHLILDVKRWRLGSFPFIVFGSNAIAAYVAPIVFKSWVLGPLGVSTGGWLRVLIYMAAWWLALLLMYRKRIFFKV
jgi:predicted acyltransferase